MATKTASKSSKSASAMPMNTGAKAMPTKKTSAKKGAKKPTKKTASCKSNCKGC